MKLLMCKIGLVAGLLAIGAMLLAYGLSGPQAAASAEGGMPGGPPPQAMPVQVTVVEEKPVEIWKEFSGRLSAVDYVELRPQVSGTITEILFGDGQEVRESDVLFIIDPRPYEAAVAQAKAAVDAAKNQRDYAYKELKRAKELIETQAVSQRIYDERSNAFLIANAAYEGAEATLKDAEIDLDHAHIKAPIAGRISRAEITRGNLVEAGPGAPVLASIISKDGIYADFEVDEQTYLSQVRGGAAEEKKIPVRLFPGTSGTQMYEGTIHSFDNRIDPASGTIRARAYFPNEGGALLPGMFARVKLGSAGQTPQILLTERAIGTDQDRKFVYVVDKDQKAAYREVTLGPSANGSRVILSGLKSGETVITEGLLHIRPDMSVAPQEKGGAPSPDAMQSAGADHE